MFTGVVVENFSYVFQLTGGAGSISREEMRAFKKVWAEFANPKTQHLERARFVAFFAVRVTHLDMILLANEMCSSETDWDLRSSDLSR